MLHLAGGEHYAVRSPYLAVEPVLPFECVVPCARAFAALPCLSQPVPAGG